MLIFQIKILIFFLATRQLNVGMTASSNMLGRSQPLRIPRPKTYSGSGTDSNMELIQDLELGLHQKFLEQFTHLISHVQQHQLCQDH
jgi:hypothetical protein